MATKTSGAEFKAFYTDPEWWPKDAWHEDEEITIDGETAEEDFALDTVADDAKVIIANGYVLDGDGNDIGSFEGRFKKWRKQRNTVCIVVDAPREKVEAIKQAIKAAGGKLSG